jgi:predicted Zn-dependent protease
MLRFRAVLRTAGRPGRHLGLLRAYYETTKDFRLLEALPSAVLGQTAAKIYDFLGDVRQAVELVGDEAVIDRIAKHLAARQADAASDVDRRALHLLAFMVERRAADQAQGAGPHLDRALAALDAACTGDWAPGEPVLAARFLESAGALPVPLRDRALRQLRDLHVSAEPGTDQRFQIAGMRANALWNNSARETAVLVLGTALNEYRRAHDGRLPPSANHALERHAARLADLREFAAAEAVWLAELAGDYDAGRKRWFVRSRYDLLIRAVRERGRVSIGEGEALYAAARDEILDDLARRSDEEYTRELVRRLCDLWRAAQDKGMLGVEADLRTFGFQTLPRILRIYQYRNGQHIVTDVAHAFRTILGPREALSFLVTRAESEPAWIRRRNADFWNAHGERVAQWRHEAGALDDLEPRLLAVVLAELRRALADRRYRHHAIFYRHGGRRAPWYWEAKQPAFFTTAKESLAASDRSAADVRFIATYLFSGLDQRREAIDVLVRAYRRGDLGRNGQRQLVQYLLRQQRYAESIPLLADPGGLVDRWPGDVDHWTYLMRAYHHTGRRAELEATRARAEAHFRAEKQWTEQVIAQLGAACIEAKLFPAAVTYYDEAIAMRRKAVGGGGDGTLARYWARLSEAHAGDGNTAGAVDAAAGAIVSWGRDQDQRKRAVESLEAALRAAADLDTFQARFDEECAAQGTEKPIIRKALGRVLLEKKEYATAAVHLEAYRESGPFDAEVYELLIQAHDGAGAPGKASDVLLAQARASGHDLALYRKLGDRLTAGGDHARAERAYTTLAEQSAHESEGRALLAGVREAQRRFRDAAEEWRQVARIRSKEPTGYLGRARCLIKAGANAEARSILEAVLGRSWPERFEKTHEEARALLEPILRR